MHIKYCKFCCIARETEEINPQSLELIHMGYTLKGKTVSVALFHRVNQGVLWKTKYRAVPLGHPWPSMYGHAVGDGAAPGCSCSQTIGFPGKKYRGKSDLVQLCTKPRAYLTPWEIYDGSIKLTFSFPWSCCCSVVAPSHTAVLQQSNMPLRLRSEINYRFDVFSLLFVQR